MTDNTCISHWDYRIVKQTIDGNVRYGIHEVYFDGEDVVTMTVDTMDMVEYLHPTVKGAPNPIEELRTAAELALKACNKPVIDWDELDLKEDTFPNIISNGEDGVLF